MKVYQNVMVGIILVNYNGYEDTEECVRSIYASNAENYKIIIVDNYSTDDSRKKLNKLQKIYDIAVLFSDQNGGFSYGNNIGIKYALDHRCDYVLLLNNDTLVAPDFLDELLKPFNIFDNCGITIGKILYAREPDKIWYAGGSFNWKTSRTDHFHMNENNRLDGECMQSVTFATGCCMLISADTIKEIGYLDESYFMYDEDCDYCLRTLGNGKEIIYIPTAVIYHKISASAGRDSNFSQFYIIRNHYRIIRKYISSRNKPIAYMYYTVQTLFRCLKSQYSFSVYVKAVAAFMRSSRS